MKKQMESSLYFFPNLATNIITSFSVIKISENPHTDIHKKEADLSASFIYICNQTPYINLKKPLQIQPLWELNPLFYKLFKTHIKATPNHILELEFGERNVINYLSPNK